MDVLDDAKLGDGPVDLGILHAVQRLGHLLGAGRGHRRGAHSFMLRTRVHQNQKSAHLLSRTAAPACSIFRSPQLLTTSPVAGFRMTGRKCGRVKKSSTPPQLSREPEMAS